MDAFIKAPAVKDVWDKPGHHPYEELYTTSCMSETMQRVTQYTIDSVETVKPEKKRLKDIVNKFSGLVGKVTALTSQLAGVFKRKMEAYEEEQAKNKHQQRA